MTFRLHLAFACVTLGCGNETRVADSVRVPVVSETVAVSSAPNACPATGLWSRCALIERLDRSGLAPQVDSVNPAREPPLTATGFLVRVGRGELEVYLYPDVASRERDQAKLDTTKYIAYTTAVAMESRPTLIVSGNALAVLHSRSDHQRERVGDAITAGAPVKAP